MADIVWSRFGDVPNFVEPFAGSLAVLLARPHAPNTETINDLDCYVSNFWRAIWHDPEAVAEHADWPVNEADLLARHKWLIGQEQFRERMRTDADYYDPKIAGWWVWGLCAWIGDGWCSHESKKLPHLGDGGQGINRKLPHLGGSGRGINRKLPKCGNSGRGAHIQEYFDELAARLRDVRVACGEWDRVLTESVTWGHGMTGVFLDPPYDSKEHCVNYSAGGSNVSSAVREWAIQAGENPLLKIALCGYDGEHVMPASWECVAWKTQGGYGNTGDGRGRDNTARERIWFSPACIRPDRVVTLFDFEGL